MGRLNKTDTILRNARQELSTPASNEVMGGDLILPNQSGDHSAGIVNTTPVNDTDIANKKYVDDNISAGYWKRTGTILEPITAGDDIKTTGTITAGSGVVSITGGASIGWELSGGGYSVEIGDDTNTKGMSITDGSRTFYAIPSTEGLTLTSSIDNFEAHLVTNNEAALFYDGTRYAKLATGSYAAEFTGEVDMGTNKIKNVVDPAAAQDAATKKYVDDQFPVTHASTTGQTTDDHHNQVHDIDSHTWGADWMIAYSNNDDDLIELPFGDKSGKFLRSNGEAALTWESITPTAPAGSNSQLQYNDGGAFGGAATLSWDDVGQNLLLGTDTQIQFRDSAINISSVTDGHMDIAADVSIDFTTPLLDLSANTMDITLNSAVDALNISSNLMSFDTTNNLIGIGTAAPTEELHVLGTGLMKIKVESTDSHAYVNVDAYTGNDAWFEFMEDGTRKWTLGSRGQDADKFQIRDDDNTVRFTIEQDGTVSPTGAGTQDLGDSSNYWNVINYKTLTDRGCLGWFDDGVLMPDGNIYSDLTALSMIKKHPTKLTIYGKPMLDYKSFPKVAYDDGGEGDEGVEMTSMFSIFIGAFKEALERIEKLEAEVKLLKQ